MGCSLAKINIHIIFHIKNNSPRMLSNDLEHIFKYIEGIISNLGGNLLQIGGVSDHIHILTSLPKELSISEFVRSIKVGSSKWIKTIHERYTTFGWQNGYGAFSVSPSVIDSTIYYIKNQVRHHKNKTYTDEYKLFLDAYDIKYDEQYIFTD